MVELGPVESDVKPSLRQGRRLRALSEGFQQTIKYSLRGVRPDQFADVFPGMSQTVLDLLYDGYRQALHGARVHTESEFDAVCEEVQLSDKLHAIEELCESRGISQPSSSVATRATRAALLSAKQAEVGELSRILEAVRRRRGGLEAELAAARDAVSARAAALRPLGDAAAVLEKPVQDWVLRPTPVLGQ